MKGYEFILARFNVLYGKRDVQSITSEEILSFLTEISDGKTQNTKRNRYATLSAFFNFISNTVVLELDNPCNAKIVKKVFRRPKPVQCNIYEKDVIDEVIFRTTNQRNRLMLELMARGGMRISEVLKLTPADVADRKLYLKNPKSGRKGEVVFIPQKLSVRLQEYIKEEDIDQNERIFAISYMTARAVVREAGSLVGILLRPHDLRRHAATYASRSGTPIEIVSKIILRHANLATTQQYLGKVSETEAMRWIENLHG